jgi:small-conductance mechanosensitive channel/CRP-like cAMP-binding protein
VHVSIDVLIGAAGLLLTIAARAFSSNTLIRSKLRMSLAAFGISLALAVVAASGVVSKEAAASLWTFEHALLELGTITLLVVLALNPWREDRVPDQFPNILQDTIIIVVFFVVATVVMPEKFLTTSAVGSVVIGFALQDTLGNLFAGLAIQVEKPFSTGQWIKIGPHEGRVDAITWRATRIVTKNGDAVVVPNNIISKEAIVNYSEPGGPTRMMVDIGASYDVPPNRVKAVILAAVKDAPLALASPLPFVGILDFAASAITYRVKFWIADWANDDVARDQVRTAIYYAFRRESIEIPFPIEVQITREPMDEAATDVVGARALQLAGVPLFASLSDDERARLAAVSRERLYGAGQTVVRQSEAGDSMFIVVRGAVRITIGDPGVEVATTRAGGYFGEMSLLTGEPRTATVSAIDDCLLLEIGAGDFRGIALAHPGVLEQIGAVVAERRMGLEKSRLEAAGKPGVAEAPRTFMDRVKQFLKI